MRPLLRFLCLSLLPVLGCAAERSPAVPDYPAEMVEPGMVLLGDNVLDGRIPRIGEYSMMGNIRTCDGILKSSARIYVPGHGKTGGKERIRVMRTCFSTVYTNVKRLYDEGQSDVEMKDEISAALRDYAD